MSRVLKELSERKWLGYCLAVFGVATITGALKLFGGHINPTTVALVLLLAILFIATGWGSRPAIVASLLSVVCFNFFYLPPVGAFTISDPHNWIALVAFLITAITAGELSARAKRRAKEADAGRREIERLYKELQESFERSSQAKALEQSARLKSALLDAVTHDLRTPLTSIKASITTLLDENDGVADEGRSITLDADSRREMLEVINEESDRLDRFIGGLIELARIEAGEMNLQPRWGAIDEIVAAALSRAESLTRRHRIKVDIEGDLPIVRVDSRAVSEVVYTLVDNAAKYSPTETTIIVEARRAHDEMVQIAVEDEGQGVAPDLRERVFDKFFRATRDGDVSTHQPSGTGMGLAIAKGIVEAHDGRIFVEETASGKGTRVVFTLPVGDEDESTKQSGEFAAQSIGAAD